MLDSQVTSLKKLYSQEKEDQETTGKRGKGEWSLCFTVWAKGGRELKILSREMDLQGFSNHISWILKIWKSCQSDLHLPHHWVTSIPSPTNTGMTPNQQNFLQCEEILSFLHFVPSVTFPHHPLGSVGIGPEMCQRGHSQKRELGCVPCEMHLSYENKPWWGSTQTIGHANTSTVLKNCSGDPEMIVQQVPLQSQRLWAQTDLSSSLIFTADTSELCHPGEFLALYIPGNHHHPMGLIL